MPKSGCQALEEMSKGWTRHLRGGLRSPSLAPRCCGFRARSPDIRRLRAGSLAFWPLQSGGGTINLPHSCSSADCAGRRTQLSHTWNLVAFERWCWLHYLQICRCASVIGLRCRHSRRCQLRPWLRGIQRRLWWSGPQWCAQGANHCVRGGELREQGLPDALQSTRLGLPRLA